MYRFNRFYLIGALIAAYTIPFITFTSPAPTTEPDTQPQLILEAATQQIVLTQPAEESFNWIKMIWTIYIIVTVMLLIKNIISVAAIKRIQGKKEVYQNYRIILIQKNIAPFSFWNTIYLGENYIKDDELDPRIFLHEKSHIDQKHSMDLIFIELFKIFTWFNPVLFLYKKAITTNHEFLADEAVLNSRFNIKDYQNLILDEIISSQNPRLTHSFNFNNTKKRFIMMNAKKSRLSPLKKATGLIAIAIAATLFAEKKYPGNSMNTVQSDIIAHKAAGSEAADPYQEFKDILNKYSDLLNSKKYAEFSKKITPEDKIRLEELYNQLTDAQRNEQKITFVVIPSLKKRIPTENELHSFLNKTQYAVWIDSEKIENSSLKNYKTSDFSHVSISKVAKNARTTRNPQPYQVTLMTHDYFEKSKKERSATAMGFKTQAYQPSSDTIAPKNLSNLKEGKYTNASTDQDFVQAELPDGWDDLKKQLSKTYDTNLFAGKEGLIKSTALIHIDETGKVGQITATGNNEKFNNELVRTLIALNKDKKWNPATRNGIPTSTIVRFPAAISFQ
jgi:beta-lactamase regulating signal transducer with metallopeptidase domain